MKKVALILLMDFLLASNVFSYTIITDPNVFYAFFEKPTKIIDFTELQDGTSYNSIQKQIKSNTSPAYEPDCINIRPGDFEALTVLSSAFSNAWSFQGN